MDKYKEQFINIIKDQKWLMGILEDVRDLKLSDSFVAAGAIRNTIWNYLHKYPTDSNQNDVDVIYYDDTDVEGKKEKEYENILKSKESNFRWEVINQFRTHLFKQKVKRIQAKSSSDSISYWTETPTCIGVRLEDNNDLTICAPYGFEDLMTLFVRPNPGPYQDMAVYKRRVNEKNWKKIWPKLTIVE